MGLFDLFGWGKDSEDDTPEKRIRKLEIKRSMIMIKLSREKQKPDPNPGIIDSFEREIKLLDEQIKKVK